MEISNLVTENLSFTANLSIMSADSNASAETAVVTMAWSESRWVRGKIRTLLSLHINSTLASESDCTFDEVIVPLTRISLPPDHDLLHPAFKHGSTVASKIEKFLALKIRLNAIKYANGCKSMATFTDPTAPSRR